MSLFGFKFQNIREVISNLGFKRQLIPSFLPSLPPSLPPSLLLCLSLFPSLSHELFKIGVLKISRTRPPWGPPWGMQRKMGLALLLVTYARHKPFSAYTGPVDV